MIGEGAITDEGLDAECICNKAPVWLEEQTVQLMNGLQSQ